MNNLKIINYKSLFNYQHLKTLSCRNIAVKIIQKPEVKHETHDEKNIRLQRALSPHLTIYKYQLTSVLSITHRFTGIALTGYAITLGLSALVLPHDFSHFVTIVEGLNMSENTLVILKTLLAFPVVYHGCNGVRHLLWDKAKFLTIKEVYATGYVMLIASIGVTILLALL
ncbi:succinate dehydrogenase cytochrome b560 subunit, mitochondrial-like [Condylostylus longicornis]|uniref:succinate dehydrogenase cytochrome b560 subunit, mitochondrial-like n=1 Tax=Condylostylus longicornis TaxID=2530218 RepID=UPI00244E2073|nr:succinate dehydrogenase cytochrome b560 subunit, mitochondrial-like [Condylostylus longicornis]